MNCPIDNTQLAITERQGVEIDYCPKCRGVWLDRGELDKIIDKSEQAAASHTGSHHLDSRQYRQPEQDRHYPKKKKRESFLEDLFDF